MGLFSNFSGSRSRNDAASGHNAFRQTVQDNTRLARNYLTQGRDSAQARFEPYSGVAQDLTERGQQGFDLYGDAIGAGTAEGRQAAFDNFQSDPFLEYSQGNNALALRDIHRNMNAQGMVGSGANALAQQRAAGDFARRDVSDYLGRLQGYGQNALSMGLGTGTGIAGQQANIDYGSGQQLANLQTNAGNAIAHSQLGNALYDAGTRSAGINNLLKLVGTGTNAAAKIYGAS